VDDNFPNLNFVSHDPADLSRIDLDLGYLPGDHNWADDFSIPIGHLPMLLQQPDEFTNFSEFINVVPTNDQLPLVSTDDQPPPLTNYDWDLSEFINIVPQE
jgi:hypothetical protein